MIYKNPVLSGFYPDPSVCCVNGRYYMVCSSFQYFPGVPLLESDDLVNWKQIGHCLTRKSQIQLDKINSSGGVFAPTIRYNNGRFYMVTTNDTLHRNFYVYTDDIYGEWSEPVFVDRDGIDPSLLFDNGKCYFISNGQDDHGVSGIVQCEIDIETGRKLSESRTIWQGSGGRFLESPHMYKIGDMYYILAAEGGTEYGHMVTCARSKDVWGPFEGCPDNPILTNRNLGGNIIQGVGHGDLIQDKNGNRYILHLGFRQTGQWSTYHHLGREVYLTPAYLGEDGWFTAGIDGTTADKYEISGNFVQSFKNRDTFTDTSANMEWIFLRHPDEKNYSFTENELELTGTEITLDMADSPTAAFIRQREFMCDISCTAELSGEEAGITIYMDENHHYDLALRKASKEGFEVIERLCIGDVKSVQNKIYIANNKAELIINADNYHYRFSVNTDKGLIILGEAQTRYLSSEVAGGFTGVLIGLYATGKNTKAKFSDFICKYK